MVKAKRFPIEIREQIHAAAKAIAGAPVMVLLCSHIPNMGPKPGVVLGTVCWFKFEPGPETRMVLIREGLAAEKTALVLIHECLHHRREDCPVLEKRQGVVNFYKRVPDPIRLTEAEISGEAYRLLWKAQDLAFESAAKRPSAYQPRFMEDAEIVPDLSDWLAAIDRVW